MTNREITWRVNSIKKALISIGFDPESHNQDSFFHHYDSGFNNKKGYNVYVTYSNGWTIKVVDLDDKNDNRNVISGTLSFNNERNSAEFFQALFNKILFKVYVKGRTDSSNEIMAKIKGIWDID